MVSKLTYASRLGTKVPSGSNLPPCPSWSQAPLSQKPSEFYRRAWFTWVTLVTRSRISDNELECIVECWYLQGRFNPRMPKVKIHLRTPKGGWVPPSPGISPSRPNFLKIFLMGMFSGSRNPTVIMKKFYLYCMTLKIKVKHLFAWPFLSPVVKIIQSWSWCRF